jgi:hypothetical protein
MLRVGYVVREGKSGLKARRAVISYHLAFPGSTEENVIPVAASIRSRLTEDEILLRSALLDCLLYEQAPVAFATAGAALNWPTEKTAAAAAGIVAKKMVVLDEAGRVQFAYPVSAVATNHKVALADGRTLYAMCAIDALGCCFEFAQSVQVEPTCHFCGKPLRARVGGVGDVLAEPPTIYAVHVDLDKYEDWATKT